MNGNTASASVTVTKVPLSALKSTLTPQVKFKSKKVSCKKRTCTIKGSISGAAAAKKVYPIVSWAGLHTGTLTIKVISASGRPVRIDGLVVAK